MYRNAKFALYERRQACRQRRQHRKKTGSVGCVYTRRALSVGKRDAVEVTESVTKAVGPPSALRCP
jgi:hypothetical protein